MLKIEIEGFKELLDEGIPCDSVILITGSEGTLKSSLAFNLMAKYLSSGAGQGVYVTLEENEESHLRNMASLGIKKPDNLHIFDYRDIRKEWADETIDMLGIMEHVIGFYREQFPDMSFFTLDSLNSMYSLVNPSNKRTAIYKFFNLLRDRNLTSFIILEKASMHPISGFLDFENPAYFLSDGVIELGIIETKDDVKRYIQVKKMRGVRHDMRKHQLIVNKEGVAVMGSIY